MNKLLALFVIILLSFVSFAQDAKEIQKAQTKMDTYASKTGVIIKFIDYSLPNLKLIYGGIAETKIRKFIIGKEIKYFYQISNKGKYSTNTASIAYEDLLEIIKALEPLSDGASADAKLRPDYLENKFVTEDGFQIGYFISKGKTSWYLVLEKYGSDNTIFVNDYIDIDTAFYGAKNKIDELKKMHAE